MNINESIVIFILIGVLSLIAISPLLKKHISCKPKPILNENKHKSGKKTIGDSIYKKWALIENYTRSLEARELLKLSGLSRTTLYRCVLLQKEGTVAQKAQFSRGERTIHSLVNEIKRDR